MLLRRYYKGEMKVEEKRKSEAGRTEGQTTKAKQKGSTKKTKKK